MTSDWSPNSDFFDILEMTDIPKEFAENAKLEFVMYWKESGQSLNSWNSKFLQHVNISGKEQIKVKHLNYQNKLIKESNLVGRYKIAAQQNLQKI